MRIARYAAAFALLLLSGLLPGCHTTAEFVELGDLDRRAQEYERALEDHSANLVDLNHIRRALNECATDLRTAANNQQLLHRENRNNRERIADQRDTIVQRDMQIARLEQELREAKLQARLSWWQRIIDNIKYVAGAFAIGAAAGFFGNVALRRL